MNNFKNWELKSTKHGYKISFLFEPKSNKLCYPSAEYFGDGKTWSMFLKRQSYPSQSCSEDSYTKDEEAAIACNFAKEIMSVTQVWTVLVKWKSSQESPTGSVGKHEDNFDSCGILNATLDESADSLVAEVELKENPRHLLSGRVGFVTARQCANGQPIQFRIDIQLKNRANSHGMNAFSEKILHNLVPELKREFCDVVLSVKGHHIPAHKMILGAFSPVFKSMFASDQESVEVELHNVEPRAAEEMLKFMYCAPKFPELDDDKLRIDVYKISAEYKVELLTNICSVSLKKALNAKNSMDVLLVACQYSDEPLKLSALEFIAKHPDDVDLDPRKCKELLVECPDLFQFLLRNYNWQNHAQ